MSYQHQKHFSTEGLDIITDSMLKLPQFFNQNQEKHTSDGIVASAQSNFKTPNEWKMSDFSPLWYYEIGIGIKVIYYWVLTTKLLEES